MQPIAAGFGNFCSEPDWSRADPDKIAFSFMRGGRFQIGVYSLSTGTAEQASKATFDGVEPSWLPDGRHLVYTARNSVTNRICILDTDTQRSTPVSPPSFGPALQASVLAR
jgi:TolB protein